MPISDDQIDLLKTARNALRGWQTTAQGVEVTLQQVVMVFPSTEGVAARVVTFTWDAEASAFTVST